MSIVITTDNVEASSITLFSYTAEASELGLAPGEWPEQMETTLGNGQPFVRAFLTGRKGSYLQSGGCIRLYVFND